MRWQICHLIQKRRVAFHLTIRTGSVMLVRPDRGAAIQSTRECPPADPGLARKGIAVPAAEIVSRRTGRWRLGERVKSPPLSPRPQGSVERYRRGRPRSLPSGLSPLSLM